ncbi:Ig-like domain-containing protein [Plantactinospora siamensis]|uniref:Ig-like domain-containing protein n=1 Tax=Plantactinospora siamensis TaxID=555372 RepID=A0ABV6NXP4_9ACTN
MPRRSGTALAVVLLMMLAAGPASAAAPRPSAPGLAGLPTLAPGQPLVLSPAQADAALAEARARAAEARAAEARAAEARAGQSRAVGAAAAPVPPPPPGPRPPGAHGQGDPIIGHYNADPYPDEAFLGTVGSTLCSVIVRYGTPGGGFGFPIAYVYLAPGLEPGGVVNCPDLGTAVDLNDDGFDELAVSWFAGPPRTVPYNLLVLRHDTFQPDFGLVANTIFQPSWMGTARFSPRGRDVYQVNDQLLGYVTYVSDGTGQLEPGPERWCSVPDRVQLRDFNLNGQQDALVTYILQCDDRSSGVVVVLDDGTFQRLHVDPTGVGTWTATIVDANGDRYPDVRTVRTQSGQVDIFINMGNGRFVLAPRAVNESFTVPGNRSSLLDVLANDYATPATTVSIVRPPRYGTARVTAGRAVAYTPGPGHPSSDSFGYRLTLNGRTSDATVSLRITG